MSQDRFRDLPHALSRRNCLLVVLGWPLVLAAGCASKGEIITPVSLNLMAGADVNPDVKGRASPLTVRVYALKSPSAFMSADFFSLYDKDSITLGADLVQREEVLLRPGEMKKLDFKLRSDAAAIGVIAAYRDLERARWRELYTLNLGKSSDLDLLFGARQIEITQRKGQ